MLCRCSGGSMAIWSAVSCRTCMIRAACGERAESETCPARAATGYQSQEGAVPTTVRLVGSGAPTVSPFPFCPLTFS